MKVHFSHCELYKVDNYCWNNRDVVIMCCEVLEQDRRIVNDDRVKFEVLASLEPHPMSYYGPDSVGFQAIKKSVRQIWGSKNVIVSAGLE